MKMQNLLWAVILGALGAQSAMAQTPETGDANTTAAAGSARRGQMLSFLSAEDRQHLLRVRRQVLETNPDLKTEQESLRKEAESVRGKGSSATAEDKKTLLNNFRAHREKMDAAMVKADPTVQPILDQIEAHRKARFQQAGGDDSGNS